MELLGGRNISILRFADDIYALAEDGAADSAENTCTRYKMESSAGKTKVMANGVNDIKTEITVKGQNLGDVTNFRCLDKMMMAKNRRLPKTLFKQLQLVQR